jgi:hypothetical protein
MTVVCQGSAAIEKLRAVSLFLFENQMSSRRLYVRVSALMRSVVTLGTPYPEMWEYRVVASFQFDPWEFTLV